MNIFLFVKFHFDYHTSIYFVSFLEMVRMNNSLMTTGTKDIISACWHVWWYFQKYVIVSVFLMPKHLYLCRELDYDMEIYFKSLKRYISITFKGICIVSDNKYFCIFHHQEKQTNKQTQASTILLVMVSSVIMRHVGSSRTEEQSTSLMNNKLCFYTRFLEAPWRS